MRDPEGNEFCVEPGPALTMPVPTDRVRPLATEDLDAWRW